MEFSDIPINRTEQIIELYDSLCQEERESLVAYIEPIRDQAQITSTCNLECFKCAPMQVLGCIYDNPNILEEYIAQKKEKKEEKIMC